MAYSKFTLTTVKEKFGLVELEEHFTANLQPLAPSDWLVQTLKIGKKAGRFSEKSRSETMVMPIILELQNRNEDEFGVYSGASLETDRKLGLKGECDFVLSLGKQTRELESAIFCMIEAKDNDIDMGLGQCVAQMVSARLFNKKIGKEKLSTIYGCVTTGDEWQFLRLKDNDITIDAQEYYFGNLDEVLGALQLILDMATSVANASVSK